MIVPYGALDYADLLSARHTTATLTPRNAAARRKLIGRPDLSSRFASSRRRRVTSGSSTACRPRPGASCSNASGPPRSNRAIHSRTVGCDTFSAVAISSTLFRSSHIRTMRLLRTTRTGAVVARAQRSSVTRTSRGWCCPPRCRPQPERSPPATIRPHHSPVGYRFLEVTIVRHLD